MKLHIGSEIKRVMEEKGIQSGWLATKINTSPRNLYDILTRESIGTDQLLEISEALDFNFFTLYTHEEEIAGFVSEPKSMYITKHDKVQIVIELDGLQTTLEQWIKRLTAINTALNQST